MKIAPLDAAPFGSTVVVGILGGFLAGPVGFSVGAVLGSFGGVVAVAMVKSARDQAADDDGSRLRDTVSVTPTPPVPTTLETPLSVARPRPTVDALDLARQLTILDRQSREQPEAALPKVEALLEKYPENAVLHAMIAEIHLSSGRLADAAPRAEAAIRLGLKRGAIPRALKLFQTLSAEVRETVPFGGETLLELGLVLARQGQLDDSAWCLMRLEKLSDTTFAQQLREEIQATDPEPG